MSGLSEIWRQWQWGHWATFRILETVIIMGSGTGFELLLQ
jgi:hypothetical protein